MTLIKGINVTLYELSETGTDDFGAPVCMETPVTVANVLVCPASSDDVTSATNLYGKTAVYTLGIPKGDTHEWENRTVEFFGRKWRSFGMVTQGIDTMIPLDWNKKVQVEAYE